MPTRQLPQLPANIGLLDTDLLHTRQGATDKSITGELSKQGHGGTIPWVATFNFLAGAYTSQNGLAYRAVIGSLNQDPSVDDGTNWVPAFNTGALEATGTDTYTGVGTPGSPIERQIVLVQFANDNTGASTLDGVDINLRGGVTDPAAGDIEADAVSELVYRTSPGAHYELISPAVTTSLSTGVVNTVVITDDTVYNPPAGVKSLEIIATGGGGGSGGVDGQGAGTIAITPCGGVGATSILTTSVIDASYTIVIGDGGAGGAGAGFAGIAGEATTVTSTSVSISCPGGLFSNNALGSAGPNNYRGGAQDTAAPTGGDINLVGPGSATVIYSNGAILSVPAAPQSYWGPGGKTTTNAGQGQPGVAFGSGGAGSAALNSSTDYAGADGEKGVVVIKEYF
jgi:hypothetical protein